MIIIANLKNFTLSHDIIVMEDNGTVQNKFHSSVKDIVENIVEQCHMANDNAKVKLMGNKMFANKISKEIVQLGLAKYSSSIEVEIV